MQGTNRGPNPVGLRRVAENVDGVSKLLIKENIHG